jgi:hypothetical protein
MGDTKLERFLPKNQHTQRKLLNFEFWIEFVTPTTITCRNDGVFPFLHVNECKCMEIFYLYI